jgi:hypothetical protein
VLLCVAGLPCCMTDSGTAVSSVAIRSAALQSSLHAKSHVSSITKSRPIPVLPTFCLDSAAVASQLAALETCQHRALDVAWDMHTSIPIQAGLRCLLLNLLRTRVGLRVGIWSWLGARIGRSATCMSLPATLAPSLNARRSSS